MKNLLLLHQTQQRKNSTSNFHKKSNRVLQEVYELISGSTLFSCDRVRVSKGAIVHRSAVFDWAVNSNQKSYNINKIIHRQGWCRNVIIN